MTGRLVGAAALIGLMFVLWAIRPSATIEDDLLPGIKPEPHVASAQSSSSEVDRAALVALYNATDGPNWRDNTNWLSDRPIGEWYRVETDETGRVIEIRLSSNELSGPIPAELGNLSKLTQLFLYNNRLSGPIPAELGNLSNLTELWLSSNQLSGELPRTLTGLTSLNSLGFSDNPMLCAPVDDSFQTWLRGIDYVSGSSCTAADSPDDRATLAALYNVTGGPNWENSANWLSDRPLREWRGVETDADGRVITIGLHANGLSGQIPRELGNLFNLTHLYLQGNQLSGSIPAALGSLSNLKRLYLYNNQLSGQIPRELGNLYNLTHLYLWNHQLSGQIPRELGNLYNLKYLYLPNNQLSGQIPRELGNLYNLEELWLSGNQLSGQIPAELGNLSNLTYLDLDGNQLSGQIPAALGRLSNLGSLDLGDNLLSGPIPRELGNLSNLRRLDLDDNLLSGCVPSALRSVRDNDFGDLGLAFCIDTPTPTPTPTPTFTPTALPNLTVSSVSSRINSSHPLGKCWMGIGETIRDTQVMQVTVRNTGTGRSGPFSVDHGRGSERLSSGLGPGSSWQFEVEDSQPHFSYDVSIQVDVHNEVMESNEYDNVRVFSLPPFITPTPPTNLHSYSHAYAYANNTHAYAYANNAHAYTHANNAHVYTHAHNAHAYTHAHNAHAYTHAHNAHSDAHANNAHAYTHAHNAHAYTHADTRGAGGGLAYGQPDDKDRTAG